MAATRYRNDPQVQIRELNEDSIKFVLSNIDTSVANAVRRVMMSEVTTMCIDMVEVFENTSPLTDEFICHRLGLIPLNYNYTEQNFPFCAGPAVDDTGTLDHRFMDFNECDSNGEGDYRCSTVFELNVEFRPDADESEMTKNVTSKDLVPVSLADGIFPDVNPVHFSSQEERDNSHDDGILIVKLARGQKIHMRCIAILGIGKQHAKWSPVSACSFMCKPVVIPNVAAFNLLSPDQQDEIRAVCREPHIFDSSHAGGPVDVENTKDWLFTGELEDVCRKVTRKFDHDIVSISRDDSTFIFNVETTGAMPPYEVVHEALKLVTKKMRYLKAEIQREMANPMNNPGIY